MTKLETLRPNPHVAAGAVAFGNDLPLAVLAGPCQMDRARTRSRWRLR